MALANKGDKTGMMQLAHMTSNLMPDGKPDLLSVVKYPTIKKLIANEGYPTMLKSVLFMVESFCKSFNVVRNMTIEQMTEAAAMLLEECDNFRLEDYQMMFTMAKRGMLGDVWDRIDIQVISSVMNRYYEMRRKAGEKYFEEQHEAEKKLLYEKPEAPATEEEKLATQRFSDLVKKMKDEKTKSDLQAEEERRKKIAAEQEKMILRYAAMNNITPEEVKAELGIK